MANVDEILNAMLEDMKKYKKEYEDATVQVNSIAKEYSDKINDLQKQRIALQEEGNKKIEVLDARRSQLSGMYSSLYEQYKRFAGKEPDFTTVVNESPTKVVSEKPKNEKVDDEKQKEEKVKVKKDKMTDLEKAVLENVNEVDDKNSKLSQDEIAKLSQITNSTNDNVVKDSNGNEIPEYLVDSYKK